MTDLRADCICIEWAHNKRCSCHKCLIFSGTHVMCIFDIHMSNTAHSISTHIGKYTKKGDIDDFTVAKFHTHSAHKQCRNDWCSTHRTHCEFWIWWFVDLCSIYIHCCSGIFWWHTFFLEHAFWFDSNHFSKFVSIIIFFSCVRMFRGHQQNQKIFST